MDRLAALALVSLPLSACASLPPLAPWKGPDAGGLERGAAVLAGVRDFTGDGDFGDTDETAFGGLELVWKRPAQALAWELALQHASDSEDLPFSRQIEVDLTELQFGLRYHAPLAATFQPYLGAGLAALYARSKSSGFGVPTEREEEWDAGLYLHAGLWAPLGADLRLGFDLRWLASDWLGAGDFDLDSTQIAVTVGTGF